MRIGVHAFERQAPQRMWFDVDLCVPLAQAAAAHDDIAHTLDYDFIRAVIAQVVGDQHHELQETLCDRIATQLLGQPGGAGRARGHAQARCVPGQRLDRCRARGA